MSPHAFQTFVTATTQQWLDGLISDLEYIAAVVGQMYLIANPSDLGEDQDHPKA